MDVVKQHRAYAPSGLGVAIVTASDSRAQADDRSGALIRDLAARAGHDVVYRRVVPDDLESIRNLMRDLIGRPDVDVVVATGGTGFSPRDVSVEAVSPLFARSIDGFGELFRMLSYEQIESAAMLSRACAGVADDTVIFVVPGSPKAVRLALERLILPEIGHLVGQIRRAGTAS